MPVQIDVDVVGFIGSSSKIALGNDGSLVIQVSNPVSGEVGSLAIGSDGSLGSSIEPISAVHASKATVTSAPVNPTDVVNKAALDAAIGTGGAAPVAEDDTGWITPTLIGNWQNYGNSPTQTQAPVGYRRIGKRVQLRGALKNPSLSGYNNSNLFKLPAGFFPGRQVQMLLNNVDKPCPVKIQTDGFVYVVGVDATWLALDSVSFLID